MLPLALVPERAHDSAKIDALMDRGFGTERRRLPAYAMRAKGAWVRSLAYVALDGRAELRGSLRFWPVRLQSTTGPDEHHLLLGPLAIDPLYQGQGIGRHLIRRGLEDASKAGWRLCFVVGEPKLYIRYGFSNAVQLGFRTTLPGIARKFQVYELQRGAISAYPQGGQLLPIASETDYEATD